MRTLMNDVAIETRTHVDLLVFSTEIGDTPGATAADHSNLFNPSYK